MALRPITTTAELKPWLPSDYSGTGWTDTLLQQALDDGADPRLLAAEVWEDLAVGLDPSESDGSDRTISSWQNLDLQVTYGASASPREVALRQARFHRARAKVKTVRFTHRLVEGEPPAEE